MFKRSTLKGLSSAYLHVMFVERPLILRGRKDRGADSITRIFAFNRYIRGARLTAWVNGVHE